jgi:hypothetical protein
MEYVGQEFSGEYDWVETEMFWIQNHMVAPKENALACEACHSGEGRLDFEALGYEAERAAVLMTFPPVEPTPTPEPTEEPTPEPTEVPPTEVPPTEVPEPTAVPTEAEAPATPAEAAAEEGGIPTWAIIIGIFGIVAVFSFFIIKGNQK